jgi:toxin ParE1/3/4
MILLLSDEAKDDLADFWLFHHRMALENGQDAQILADSAVDTFFKRARDLELFPEMGRRREELGKGIRCLPIRKYLVFYKVRSNDVLLVRVIHGSRDLETIWNLDS